LIRQPHGERGRQSGLPDQLHVERRGQAEVQRLAHDVRRQKIKHGAREIRGSSRARKPAHIIFRRRVAGLERNQNVRVARPMTPLVL
jgi:hypothetical protein